MGFTETTKGVGQLSLIGKDRAGQAGIVKAGYLNIWTQVDLRRGHGRRRLSPRKHGGTLIGRELREDRTRQPQDRECPSQTQVVL
jgi:hypothetical protein